MISRSKLAILLLLLCFFVNIMMPGVLAYSTDPDRDYKFLDNGYNYYNVVLEDHPTNNPSIYTKLSNATLYKCNDGDLFVVDLNDDEKRFNLPLRHGREVRFDISNKVYTNYYPKYGLEKNAAGLEATACDTLQGLSATDDATIANLTTSDQVADYLENVISERVSSSPSCPYGRVFFFPESKFYPDLDPKLVEILGKNASKITPDEKHYLDVKSAEIPKVLKMVEERAIFVKEVSSWVCFVLRVTGAGLCFAVSLIGCPSTGTVFLVLSFSLLAAAADLVSAHIAINSDKRKSDLRASLASIQNKLIEIAAHTGC